MGTSRATGDGREKITLSTRCPAGLQLSVMCVMDAFLTARDNVGEYTQADDGRYQFVYGPLVVAMTEGRVLFIDDAVRHEAP
jgi:hypothetical protein